MSKKNRSVIQPSTSGSIKNILPALIAFFLCIILIGIGVFTLNSNDETSTDNDWIMQPDRTNISNTDIAQALRLTKWTVRLPEDLSSEDQVGIVKQNPDGKSFVGTSGFKPGSTVTVLLQNKNGTHKWTLRSKLHTTHTTTTLNQNEKRHMILYSSKRNGLKPGDFLLKGTSKTSSDTSNELQEGEFVFSIQVRKNDEE